MPIPVRVTPPVGEVVSLDALKRHLRVDGEDSDDAILALERQAVAHLDGYRGILGRCILPQQWAVTFEQAGTFRLPLPDVSVVAASVGTATLEQGCLGSVVTITDPCTVTMTCALPDDALEAVRGAICIWVEKRFEGLTGPEAAAFDAAFNDLIAPLRRIGL